MFCTYFFEILNARTVTGRYALKKIDVGSSTTREWIWDLSATTIDIIKAGYINWKSQAPLKIRIMFKALLIVASVLGGKKFASFYATWWFTKDPQLKMQIAFKAIWNKLIEFLFYWYQHVLYFYEVNWITCNAKCIIVYLLYLFKYWLYQIIVYLFYSKQMPSSHPDV